MSLRDIAITMIGPQPLFAWLGLLALLLLLATAGYGYALFKGKVRSLKAHQWLAGSTLVVMLVHAGLALATML
jgi:hypothetical protein